MHEQTEISSRNVAQESLQGVCVVPSRCSCLHIQQHRESCHCLDQASRLHNKQQLSRGAASSCRKMINQQMTAGDTGRQVAALELFYTFIAKQTMKRKLK